MDIPPRDVNDISFLAEFRKVESKKLITNDNEIKVTLVTNDIRALELAKLSTDSVLEVQIKQQLNSNV